MLNGTGPSQALLSQLEGVGHPPVLGMGLSTDRDLWRALSDIGQRSIVFNFGALDQAPYFSGLVPLTHGNLAQVVAQNFCDRSILTPPTACSSQFSSLQLCAPLSESLGHC